MACGKETLVTRVFLIFWILPSPGMSPNYSKDAEDLIHQV